MITFTTTKGKFPKRRIVSLSGLYETFYDGIKRKWGRKGFAGTGIYVLGSLTYKNENGDGVPALIIDVDDPNASFCNDGKHIYTYDVSPVEERDNVIGLSIDIYSETFLVTSVFYHYKDWASICCWMRIK